MSYTNTTFPTTLDTPINPLANNDMFVFDHAGLESFQNNAIAALETKVGVNGSAVTSSFDFKLASVTAGQQVVSLNSAQTLTNKTLTSPSIATPSITTPTITGGGSWAGGATITSAILTTPVINGAFTGTTVVPVTNGGTGLATLPANGVLVGNATGNVFSPILGTAGQALTSNGPSLPPSFQIQSTTQILSSMIASDNLNVGDAVFPVTTPAAFITLDAKANGATNSLTYTTPFTVGANANRGLVVMCASQNNSTTVSSVTYNGVAMTAIVFVTSTGYKTYAFYLQAPSTGINNLVISCSATTPVSWWANSYYNVSQTSQPESSTSLTTGASMTLTTANYFDLAVGVKVGTGSTGNGFTNNIVYDGFNTTAGDTGTLTYTGTTATFTSTGGEGVAIVLSPFTASGTTQGVVKASATTATFANSFIGFASATTARGSAVSVVVSGTVTNLSGLTAGTQYYLSNTFGALSSSAGAVTRKVAIALSSTSALITNIW